MFEHIALSKRFVCVALALLLAVGMAAVLSPRNASAETSAEVRAQAEKALEELNDLYDKAEAAAETYNEAVMAKEAADKKVKKAKKQIKEETEKIKGYQAQLSDRARAMYRSGGSNFLDVILGAESFDEFATNWNLLELMNDNDAKLVADTKESRTKLEAAKVELEEQAEEAKKQAAAAKEASDKAEAATKKAKETYEALDAKAKKLLEEEEAAEAAAAAAAAEQAKKEQEAQRAAEAAAAQSGNNQSSTSTDSGDDDTQSGSSSSSGGSGSSVPVNTNGSAIVDRAYSQLGKPYVWGATGMSSFDCSGLVGYALTGSNSRICTSGTCAGWPSVSNPQPGDICVRSGHVGVYIGGGMMIHAPQTGDVVKVAPVQSSMWYVRYPG